VVDVVMLCVKLWDTDLALQQIRPMIGPGTTLISFKNGVLKDRYLRAAFDVSQIMGGVGCVASTIDRPGVWPYTLRESTPKSTLKSTGRRALHQTCTRWISGAYTL
jgi:ketopantoate reductase